jgi:hypothetical protein
MYDRRHFDLAYPQQYLSGQKAVEGISTNFERSLWITQQLETASPCTDIKTRKEGALSDHNDEAGREDVMSI